MTAGLVFWFTGLSGAGKTTVATLAAARLRAQGRTVLVLDGDDLRPILSPGLGFGRADVLENNTRVATYCQEHRGEAEALLVPIISPYAEGRASARAILSPGFFEVWLSAGLDTVMARDPKGLYARARAGKITDMIGYAPDYPYEHPETAELVIPSGAEGPGNSAATLTQYILDMLSRA